MRDKENGWARCYAMAPNDPDARALVSQVAQAIDSPLMRQAIKATLAHPGSVFIGENVRGLRGIRRVVVGRLTVTKHAGLVGVRLHDLRHTYASFGAGGGLGLPIIGLVLGHAQAATTARYAHLDNDPLRHASEAIAGRIAAALNGNRKAVIATLRKRALSA